MKNFLKVCNIIALVSIGLAFMAGCESEPKPGKGVLGQLSGVVVDGVTFLPIKDVEVKLTGTGNSVKTDVAGTYRFSDVAVGSQALAFSVDGYQFNEVAVSVTATDYKTDDPFAEYEALQGQLEALLASAGGGIIKVQGTTTGDTVEISQASEGLYEVKTIKLDYTYVVNKFNLVTLVPLKGELNAKIKVVKIPYNANPTVTLTASDFVDIQNDVEVWVTRTGSIGVRLL